MRLRSRLAAALATGAALALSACGYAFETRYAAQGGAERIHVRPFENLSTEASLGAEVTRRCATSSRAAAPPRVRARLPRSWAGARGRAGAVLAR
jgi:outer membrane lipopolysaccharide assembly protein LptE/RlpB